MKHSLLRLSSAFAALIMASSLAYGQGGATSAPLSGLVTDASGAVAPGAVVVVKNQDTGATYQTVTNAQGAFTVPALQAGTYSVNVSLTGFKKVVLKDVKMLSATPGAVKAVLEPGGMEESVLVEGAGSSLVQTQSAAVATTVEVNQVNNLPVQDRGALNFLTGFAGVSTAGGARDSIISGLDQSAVNITVDGLSVQDNFLKTTDGYFARLSPRLDQVEEVTMTTAAGGADTSGGGGVQIRFVTRQGTNEYHGSAYEYYRRDKLNANTWFNNRDLPPGPNGKAPQAALKFDNYGFRFGGPIKIPGLFDGHNKAFFFVNYEEIRTPADVSRQRIILSPSAEQGVFTYAGGTVNLMQLAAANGQTATLDPTVAKVLADIRASTAKGGVAALPDPLTQRFSYQSGFSSTTKFPSARLDFQVTQKHRITATYTLNKLLSDPDTLNNRDANFPGFPVHGVQDSKRWAGGGSVRSILSENLVNDVRVFGATGGATLFSTEINPSLYKGTSVADQLGYHLNFNGQCCATFVATTTNQTQNIVNASTSPDTSSREASTRVASETLSWIRGSHNFTFGTEFTQADVWLQNQQQVPQITFGIANGDPALSMFTTANFPGASATNLSAAQGLYAILTGRVTSIVTTARLDENSNQYTYLGSSVGRARLREFDFFAQDSWRAKSNLTLSYGLRYVLQLPMFPTNDSFTTPTLEDLWGVSGVNNLFKPGIGGKAPVFNQFKKGTPTNKKDLNNLAPNVGVTWRPTLDKGFLRAVFGSEPVFRAGYAMAYSRNGMSDFTDQYNNNPGISVDATRSQGNANLGPVPLLFRNQSALGPPAFNQTPSYPLGDVITQDIRMFDPNLKVPVTQSWTAGIQRKLSNTTAIELRYIGTRGSQLWTTRNLNESNIVENGFLNEFRLAQANLQANVRAGRGNSFAYFGPGTGTAPLPIYLAYFNGAGAALAGDPSRYTGGNWTSTNFTNPLAIFNPAPFTPAGVVATTGLDGDATRRANARAAGLPANFFRVNPDLQAGAFLRTNGGGTLYNAAEMEFRQRMSRGIQFTASYTFGKAYEYNSYSLRSGYQKRANVVTAAGTTPAAGNEAGVVHAFKLAGILELPFGKAKRFGGNASGLLDRIIGGWQLSHVTRVQSGRPLDWGNVRLVGMSEKELRSMFKLRFDNAGKKVFSLPQDVIDNSVKAFTTSATSLTGYGTAGAPSGRYIAPANGPDCIELADPVLNSNNANLGPGACGLGSLVVTGPKYWTTDIGIVKRIPLKKGVYFDFRAELLNAFNHANFNAVATPSSNATAYEVTSTVDAGRVAQLVGRITW